MNNRIYKTLSGKTGKDLLGLLVVKEETQRSDIVRPAGKTQIVLFDFWTSLLGHDNFGVNDDFFSIGGSSIKGIQLISNISRHFNVQFELNEIFQKSTISELALVIHNRQSDTPHPLSIELTARPEYIPLSFSQARLWFIDNLEGSLQYHIPAVIRLKGKLNTKALEYSFTQLILRHEVLRTVIKEHEGEAFQYIKPKRYRQLNIIDGSRYEQFPDLLQTDLEKLIYQPFDLSRDDMLRVGLITLMNEEYLLVISLHHIAFDGWSTEVMIRELMEFYTAFNQSREPDLIKLAVQYSDYSIWQRKYLQGEVLEKKLTYWREKLENIIPLDLPTDYFRPALQSNRGSSFKFAIDDELTQAVVKLSQQYHSTTFMTLLAAFKVLLFRYSGQVDICVGTPIAGRMQHETENLIGFFVNTLALRSEILPEQTFTSFLQAVRATTIDAYENQEVPFEQLVESLVKERELNRSPLFQVMFVLQNTSNLKGVELEGMVLNQEEFNNSFTRFDLTFNLTHSKKGLDCSVEYCTDLYNAETIQRMTVHYTELLNSIVKEPDKEVSQLHMLTPAEQQQILKTFNNTKTTYPRDKTITELFEQQAARTPKAIALVYEDQQLTYGDLNTKANQLAHYLRLRGVEPQTLVPICIERSMDMIIGILGILKSGGAYVPIDPEYPVERISYMLKDTKAKVVLSSKSSSNRLSIAKTGIIELDTERWKIDKLPTENLQTGVTPSGLAYVIYTSGSTGQPKGVMVEHGNVVRLFKTETPVFDFNEKDVWTMFHSFCFDFSVWEMFGALLYGGRLVIVPREATLDTLLFVELMESQRVTVLNQTPSAFYVLQDSVRQSGAKLSVRYVIFGGEALNPAKLHPWKDEHGDCRLINMYGITETTVHVTYREIDREQIETGRSIIGKPIPTLTSYILDKNNHPVPIGIPGEIHIGGAGLARGYLNNAELTKEKFIRDPFSKEVTSRLYKTGDIGRWLPDGNIEFLGRGDDQVKIRGYRIELGEIESAIQQSKMVSHSVVLAKEDTQGNKRLVGYVVAKGKLDKEKLSSTLRQQLPEYMVPGIWVELESLPLTPNGKVDKRSLPDPDIDQQISRGYVAPGNATESKLAEIWQELLSVGRIGIHDNFFELGGHSLLAMRLISSIRRQMELELGVRDLFRFPTIGELSSHLSSGDTTELLPGIVSQSRPERIPLSYSQERLWFIDRLEGSLQYHIPAVLRLKGKLSIKALGEGISLIMDRHEILRTVIREEAGQAYQYIKPKAEGGLQRVDGSRFKGSQKLLEQYIVEAINRPFDLSQDDMLRAELISLNTREHILVVTLHHIASDGWSTSVMVKELTEYYNACEEGRPAELEGLTIQYADYSIWQRKYLQGELLERKLSYWVVKLMGSTPLELPTDHPRGSVQSIRGGSMDFAIDNQLTESLQSLSQRYNTTMFMTLLAGFKVLLFRYTGQTDICVGTPIAGRQHHQTENLIGFFVNTLALRSTISGEAGFSEFLDQVRGTTIEAYEHQEVPFEKVVEAVVKERDLSRNPLFQVMFIMQNTPDVPDLRLGEVGLEMETPLQETSKFAMTFSIIESKKGLNCSVEYCTDLYNAETIQRMTVHYTELLNSIVKEPDKEVSQLQMLSQPEQQQILKTFNNTKTRYPKDKTITELFEQQAARTPKAIALVYEDQQLTYGELNTKANQLAHYLRLRGVEPQTLVPICIERSMDMIIGILGILKSGGAYVPIDPEYPVERISYMLKDTKAKVVLSSKGSSDRLAIAKTGIIELDTERGKIDKLPTDNLQTTAGPSGLAYVIYTSGSTGQPKGVEMPQGALVNLLLWQDGQFANHQRKVLQFASLNFDVSFQDIFSTLCFGSSLYLIRSERRLDISELLRDIVKNEITHLFLPSVILKNLAESHVTEQKLSLEEIMVAGDQLKVTLDIKAFLNKRKIKLINHYGPTEAHVVSSYEIQLNRAGIELPPIGKPIANTTVYILDKNHHPVPIGIPGEIHIGGVQLARGYLNNAKLTKEKFIRDPFSKEVTSRLYKTGDIGRWLPDGNIEFLGRGDDQVKIRGYRIELGEIENAIQQSKMVSHSVVLAKEDTQGNKRLVGYVVAKGKLDKEKLSSTLRQQLPEYMVPGIWVELESLPLTPNGKVDKRSLPDPDIDQQISRGYVAPGNATETKLAEIWQELLSVGRIGIHDNFFELGGHSLLAMRLISSIRRQMELELGVRDLFRFPTIGELSSHLSSGDTTELLPGIVSQSRPERIPLSYSQERLWFIDRLEGSLQYHIPAVLRLKGKLSIKALSEGISLIMDRHEILRTVIREEAGQAYQYIKPKAEGGLQRVDGSRFKGSQKLLEQYIVEAINRPFDLSQDDMLRAELISLNTREHMLVVTLHHIASDGWSTSVMVKELTEYYNACEEGRPAELEGLTIQYADYSIWQRKYLQGELLERKLSYWVVKLMGSTPLELPTDHPRGSVQSIRGGSMDFAIDNQLTESLQSLSQRYNTTMFMTLLAGFKVLLFRYTGQTDICVGTPIAGRQHHQTENLIGFFVNTLALRSTISGEAGFSEFLDQVRGTTIEAYEHQEVPFEKVVEAVVKERDLSRNPLFQVMFIMQNTPDVAEPDLEELTLTNESVANDTSRFELSFSIAETNGGLHVMVNYCTDLYNAETIQRMTVHYTELLNSIVKEPDKEVSQLRMLTPAEHQQILKTFNNTKTAYPKDKTITELFEQQAAITPKAIALVYEDQQLTYGELNTKANQLAHYLRLRGVESQTLVPICIERSMDMIIGILGILKSGGAYVPIDPEYPVERISYMLKDTKAKVVLSSKSSSNRLSTPKTGIIELDRERGKIDKLPTENLQTTAGPSGLAYVIYTSGSTGQPKGVMVEHGGVVNFIKAQSDYFKITVKDRILQFSNFCFDASVEQIFIALTSGASLVLFEQGLQYETESFENFISGQRITHLHATPGYIETLKLVDTKYLTRVIVGGEQCKRELANRFRGKVDFYNKYGPTETTVTVIEYKEQSKETENHGPYPIGKPIANTTVYILNKDNHPVPIGIPGEIHIGGVQLARGYLNNAKLTKEKFIRDPFSKDHTSRLYKTGDIGRWLPDGNIEFLGRGDDQVKIRGYRIELGEIESAIQQSKMVSHSVVLAKEDTQGNKRLVGYVVAKGKLDKEKLSSTLRQQLPEYMVPGIWVELESLPLTPNGKVDKRSLPDPDIDQQISRGYVAPGNATESKLAEIWQELLSVGRIGIHDNFFELGGHSLLAMRLISSIRRQMELELGVRDLFRFPTIGELSSHLSSGDTTELLPAIVSQPRPERIPLSYSQERLWFIDRLEGSLQYHMPVVFRLKGKLNTKVFGGALKTLVRRHESLRTVFKEHDGHPYQVVKNYEDWNLSIIEGSAYRKNSKALQLLIKRLKKEPFDLSNDYMLRVNLIDLDEEDHVLVVTMHHIASDGWSLSIVVKELVELYNANNEGREAQLPAMKIQFADYAIWQKNYLSESLLNKKLSYWVDKLRDVKPLRLQTDYPRPKIQSTRGEMVRLRIDRDLTDKLIILSRANGSTLYMTLLAGFKILLYRYTGQHDICIGSAIAGRQHQEMESLIGFFVNTLAIRTDVSSHLSFQEYLDQVRTTTLEAYENQEVPFEKVLDAVTKDRDLSIDSLVQVIFALQNTPEIPVLQFGDIKFSEEVLDDKTAIFELFMSLKETKEGLYGFLQYSTDLYSEESMRRLVGHYMELLMSIVNYPGKRIGDLQLLTGEEETRLIREFNETQAAYPKNKSITDLFERQVSKTPQAIALVSKGKQLTYRELNDLSNQLAHYLRERGVQEGTLVPVCMERSIDIVVAMMGILKSGGAYVPIDPGYPLNRISYILEDTKAKILITTKILRKKAKSPGIDVIKIDSDWNKISRHQVAGLPLAERNSNNLAYTIYTSGSTGIPKGVMIAHKSVVNLMKWHQKAYEVSAKSSATAMAGISFDAFGWEIWPYLSAGASVHILDDEKRISPLRLVDYFIENRITHSFISTALIPEFVNSSRYKKLPLEYLITGGDRLSPIDLTGINYKLFNNYGPTESTVVTSFYEIMEGDSMPLIGKPVANTRVYIVDKEERLVPIGIAGEIYIGGDGLALGYLNLPELTREKFIIDPFNASPGSRVYKSGDFGRWLADGNLEFLQRSDDQVKIRGYRIELGEVEGVMNKLEQVSAACAVVRYDIHATNKIVAYYSPEPQFIKMKERELYSHLIETWKELYQIEYERTEGIDTINEEFNIIGWNDSFTGNPIDAGEMKEWVKDIIDKILLEKTENVLEIGCGTGLIYYQLAGKVKKYRGTDFSKSSIDQISHRISKGLREYCPTVLEVCAAHEIAVNHDELIDTVILNSVVQYFPGEGYMTEVIGKCLEVLNGNGRIVIGDVRDDRLLRFFKGRLRLKKMQKFVGLKEFEWAVEQDLLNEEELCFSPEYFFKLKSLYPEITHVSIEWKQGDYINELTLYRYTVVVYVGSRAEIIQPSWMSWTEPGAKQYVIEQIETSAGFIALKDVPNPRLSKERLLNLAFRDKLVKNVGELMRFTENDDEDCLEVAKIISDAREIGYHYRLLLDEDPLKVNLLLSMNPSTLCIDQDYSYRDTDTGNFDSNIPLFNEIGLVLQDDIKSSLKEFLPEYMVPSEMIALRKLPLTENGKIDRKFLSEREDIALTNKLNYKPPGTELETVLVSIWHELLHYERIGIDDNFFELGGHSLLVIRLISSVRNKLKVELAVKDIFLNPSISALASHIEQAQNSEVMLPLIEVQEKPEQIPLSFSQERLWFIDRLEGSVHYHIPTVLRLKGKLNREALTYSLHSIVDRHESLRTIFREEDGQPYQHILDKGGWTFTIKDGSNYKHHSDSLKQYVQKLIRKPFDLLKDYTFRAELVSIDKHDHLLVVTMHHIASDGWSNSVIVKELVELYESFQQGREPRLPILNIQHADYAIWQRKYLQGEVLDRKLAYWKQNLEGNVPLDLPTDFQRPAIQTLKGATSHLKIDKKILGNLNKLSQQKGTTLFMTLLSAFKVLLFRYTGQTDICVGTSVAGRHQKEVEELIGYFVNTLALRTHLDPEKKFVELMQSVKSETMEAFEHQEAPFEKVVEMVVKHRDMSRGPLFQVMFGLQNTPEIPELRLGELKLSWESFEHSTSQFDLTFSFLEINDGLELSVIYCSDLFKEETIIRMKNHFKYLLGSILNNPEQSINELRIFNPKEQKLLKTFNNTKTAYPKDKTITELFEQQAAITPKAIALVYEDQQLTYGELNTKANQLAHYLRLRGVESQTLVPICIERSMDMIIGILGILKSGGAYVPIDPEYPVERISYMLKDTKAKVVLSSKSSSNRLSIAKTGIIELDTERWKIDKLPTENLQTTAGPSGLAYVIYTSGSTGQPKGVMVEHGGVVNLIKAQSDYFKITVKDRILQFSNYSFDASIEQIFLALTNGASLIMFEQGLLFKPGAFEDFIIQQRITHLHATPNWLENLEPKGYKGLKRVIAGGDLCKRELAERWGDRVNFYNEYGPTETTVTVIEYKEQSKETENHGPYPIGKPIANTTVYILDKNNHPVPIGIPGEIHIGGVQLARGYLNNAELTKEKFIRDPFSKEVTSRLYKTGDMGRWLPDGNIEFLGRGDDQVKIRGYRIELGEIENAIQQSKMVSHSVVLANEDTQGNKRLVGYVVAKGELDKEKLSSTLRQRLPEYMVPGIWVELESLPLTPNGKVDKNALSDPDSMERLSHHYVAPRNEIEEKLSAIWKNMLMLEKVGIYDNFFELGGHSLMALRIISAISKELQADVELIELVKRPNIAELAEHIQARIKVPKGLN